VPGGPVPDQYAMPDGVASIRRLSAGSGGVRYVTFMVVWLVRYLRDRLDCLLARRTLVLQPGIDLFLGLNVTLLRERHATRGLALLVQSKRSFSNGFGLFLVADRRSGRVVAKLTEIFEGNPLRPRLLEHSFQPSYGNSQSTAYPDYW